MYVEVIPPKFDLNKFVWMVLHADHMPHKDREAKIKSIVLMAYEMGKSEVNEGWEMR